MPLNIFETLPKQGFSFLNKQGVSDWHIQRIYLQDSISWNTVAIVYSKPSGNTTVSVSVGLYSLTGSTLTLVNQATETVGTAGGTSWLSLVTSATSNLTAGEWYLGYHHVANVAGAAGLAFLGNGQNGVAVNDGAYAGSFLRGGKAGAGTTALPASIVLADVLREGDSSSGSNTSVQPYILISA